MPAWAPRIGRWGKIIPVSPDATTPVGPDPQQPTPICVKRGGSLAPLGPRQADDLPPVDQMDADVADDFWCRPLRFRSWGARALLITGPG